MADAPNTSPGDCATTDNAPEDSLDELEDRLTKMGTDTNANTKSIHKHDQAILDLRRHTEDLENRSRRGNIHIRGVPENIPNEELRELATKLFSEVLNDAAKPTIAIECIHRVGVQRGTTPRDVLCCLRALNLKKGFYQKRIHFEENTIHLYQDLAASTITQRCVLKPITSSLRERGISYKWGFPFALLAHKGGKIFAIPYPLDIPIADVSKWRNYILGPPDDDLMALATDGLSTPSRLREPTPSRQWRKRLNTQSPARLPSTPLTKRQS
ncbi:hypothetical protein XELAEV_18031347mg [Xenopus laevis]|uniref:Uncharacterized protein n=1 Tax=Xenopus laevis TaxID=8355 RepID=A0A974HFY3_XENLA|nr:hypothetical protein XELAEV_18031347mg [Xenopus laevis]